MSNMTDLFSLYLPEGVAFIISTYKAFAISIFRGQTNQHEVPKSPLQTLLKMIYIGVKCSQFKANKCCKRAIIIIYHLRFIVLFHKVILFIPQVVLLIFKGQLQIKITTKHSFPTVVINFIYGKLKTNGNPVTENSSQSYCKQFQMVLVKVIILLILMIM